MTQVLPADDPFTEGATIYGSAPGFYLRYRPWTGTVTSALVQTSVGDLHSGYYLPTNQQTQAGLSKTNAAAADGTSNNRLISFQWRTYEDTSPTVQAHFALYTDRGAPTDTSFQYAAVFARAAGGALTDSGTDTEHLLQGDAYVFLLANDVSGGSFYLLRINAGSATELATSSAYPIPSTIRPQYGVTLRMHVREVAGNTTITCSYLQSFQQVDGPTSTQVFNVVDASGSKLTAAGRCGFGMNQGRSESGGATLTTVLCSHFQIIDDSNGLQVRDEFQRELLDHTRTSATDPLGNTGRDLACNYIGDLHGGTLQNMLLRDAGSDRVELDGSTSGGFMFSQRRASHPAVQHRSYSFTFQTGGTSTEQRAGIVLRGSAGTTATLIPSDSSDVYGYLFHVLYDDGAGTWTAYLDAFDGTINTQLASKVLTGMSKGTAYTIELEIHNEGGSDEFTGQVHIDAKLDSSTVIWSAPTVDGVDLDSNNIIIDTRSERILEGPAEAIYAGTDAGLSSPVLIDSWTEGSLDGDTGLPEDDQQSIVIPGEADGKTGTLDLDYVAINFEYFSERRTFRYEGGYVFRSLGQAENRRLWSLNVRLPTADRTTLRTFWDDHNGTETPFSWVDDRDVTHAVCFFDDTLGDQLVGPGVFDGSVRLLELFE